MKILKLATVFCLFGISSAVFLLFASPLEDPVTGERILQEVPLWYALYAASVLTISCLLIVSRVNKVLFLISANKLLLLLLIYMLFSSAWALDPWQSVIEVGKTIIAVSFGFFLASRFSAKELLSLLSITMAVIVISSFIISIFLPEYGVHQSGYEGAWRGAFGHKNSLATRMNIAFITFVLAAVHFKKFGRIHAIFAFLAATLVVLSQSATGIVVLLLMISSPLYIRFLRLNTVLVISLGVALLCLIYILVNVLPIFDVVLAALGRDSTLTGRTGQWQLLLQNMSDYGNGHTYFGYGAQSLSITPTGQIIVGVPDVLSVDNLYADILMKYGLVGSFIYALVLYQGLSIAIKQLKAGGSVMSNFYIVIMLILLVEGIADSINVVRIFWTFFALIFASPYISENVKIYRKLN